MIIIFVLHFAQLMGITSANEFVERRTAASFPNINFNDKNLIANLNAYFSDNFGFRNLFLKAYLFTKINLLKTNRIGQTDLGKDGWVFGAFYPGSDYRTIYKNALYTDKQLQDWKNLLEREQRYLKEQNIPFIIVTLPDKRFIYEDLLFYKDNVSSLRHRQFVDFMKNNTSLNIVDPTESLLKAKSEYPLFFKTDSHMTNYGSFIAYQEIISYFKGINPNIGVFTKGDFQIIKKEYKEWLGDSGFIYSSNPGKPEHDVSLKLKVRSQNKYRKLGAILQYGDSFLNIERKICGPCLLEEFPELTGIIDQLFIKPIDNEILKPNMDYWLIKDELENIIPIIEKNIPNKNLSKRIINHLLAQALLPEEIGLEYFFKLSFDKVIRRDISFKLDQELIDEYRPSLVIREMTDNRIKELDRVKCNYQKDTRFNDKNVYEC